MKSGTMKLTKMSGDYEVNKDKAEFSLRADFGSTGEEKKVRNFLSFFSSAVDPKSAHRLVWC